MYNEYCVFSDESGTWHEDGGIYVRSWVLIKKEDVSKIEQGIDFCRKGVSENNNNLKWIDFSNHQDLFTVLKDLDIKIIVTVSEINKQTMLKKYKLTRNFEENINLFDFGNIQKDIKEKISKKILDDINYMLFLFYYEKHHISSCYERLEKYLINYKKIYFYIDPPQMSRENWKKLATDIFKNNKYVIEFKRSVDCGGIQLADIISGAFKTFIVDDTNLKRKELKEKEVAKYLIENILLSKVIYFQDNTSNKWCNPNLIFYKECRKQVQGKIWEINNKIKNYNCVNILDKI